MSKRAITVLIALQAINIQLLVARVIPELGCPTCLPGEGQQQNDNNQCTCVSCGLNEYSKHNKCELCDNLPSCEAISHKVTEQQCTSTSNTQCGDCEIGYMLEREDATQCIKICPLCDIDTEYEITGTSCRCVPCESGHYAENNRCRPCDPRSCERNLHRKTIFNCTGETNTLCGRCLDGYDEDIVNETGNSCYLKETKAIPKEYTVEEWPHRTKIIILVSVGIIILLLGVIAALCCRKRVSKLINSCRVLQRQTAKKEKSTSDNGAEEETSSLMGGSAKSDLNKIDNTQQLKCNASENNPTSTLPLSTANNLNVTTDIHKNGSLKLQDVSTHSNNDACIAKRNTVDDNMTSDVSPKIINDSSENINVVTGKTTSDTLLPIDNGPAQTAGLVNFQANAELHKQNDAAGISENCNKMSKVTNEQMRLNNATTEISDKTETNDPTLMTNFKEDNETTKQSKDCTEDNRAANLPMSHTSCQNETKIASPYAVVDDVDNIDINQQDAIKCFDEPENVEVKGNCKTECGNSASSPSAQNRVYKTHTSQTYDGLPNKLHAGSTHELNTENGQQKKEQTNFTNEENGSVLPEHDAQANRNEFINNDSSSTALIHLRKQSPPFPPQTATNEAVKADESENLIKEVALRGPEELQQSAVSNTATNDTGLDNQSHVTLEIPSTSHQKPTTMERPMADNENNIGLNSSAMSVAIKHLDGLNSLQTAPSAEKQNSSNQQLPNSDNCSDSNSNPTDSETLALRLIYEDEFRTDQSSFLKANIDLSVGSWGKDLLDIIDKECQHDLTLQTNNDDKVMVLVRFLIRRSDIITYKKFIVVWKKYGGAKAIQFELKLRKRIENEGKMNVDNLFHLN